MPAFDLEQVEFDDVQEDVEEPSEEPTDDIEDNSPEDVSEPDDFDELDEDIDDAFSDENNPQDEEDTEDELTEEDIDSDEDVETQEETDEEEEEDVEDTRFVDDLASQFGLDTEEDLDEDLEDTWDDALKVARKGAQNLASQEINTFFEQYPDLKQYAEYRVNGGDPDTYREEVLNAPSYNDLEVEGNEQTQEQLVREKLREVDGFSEDRVDDKVETYKSAGVLKGEAEDAQEILANRQEQKQEELIKEQEKQAEQRKKEQLEEQKRYRQTIQESDSLAGLQLPEDRKDDFESYLFDPVDEEGMTQAEKDYQEMDREQALALYYLTYNGLDNLGKLVDNKASTKEAERLSDKLKKTESRDVKDRSEKSGRRKSDDPNLEGFDLDSAIG